MHRFSAFALFLSPVTVTFFELWAPWAQGASHTASGPRSGPVGKSQSLFLTADQQKVAVSVFSSARLGLPPSTNRVRHLFFQALEDCCPSICGLAPQPRHPSLKSSATPDTEASPFLQAEVITSSIIIRSLVLVSAALCLLISFLAKHAQIKTRRCLTSDAYDQVIILGKSFKALPGQRRSSLKAPFSEVPTALSQISQTHSLSSDSLRRQEFEV